MSALLERPTLSFGSVPPVPPRSNRGLAHGPLDDDNDHSDQGYDDLMNQADIIYRPEYVPLFSEVSPMILYQINEVGDKYSANPTPPAPPTLALIALFEEQKDLPEDQI